MFDKQQKIAVLEIVKAASEQWKSAFNSADASGCANQYEENAVMHARPFGTFSGMLEIRAFWQKLINEGFSEVEYLEPHIEVIDEKSAVLTFRWQMNQASGVTTKSFGLFKKMELRNYAKTILKR